MLMTLSQRTNRDLSYLYCILDLKRSFKNDYLKTFGEPFNGIRLVTYKDIAAVVKNVPHWEFSQDTVNEKLKDVSWVIKTAREHELVLDKLIRVPLDIVPFKLCTIFRSERKVRQLLEKNQSEFRACLEKIAGRVEFGVSAYLNESTWMKANITRRKGRKELSIEKKLQHARPGAAYFLKKELDLVLSEEKKKIIESTINSVFARLEKLSDRAVCNPPVTLNLKEASSESRLTKDEMILNSAFLVKRPKLDRFVSRFNEIESKLSFTAISLKLSGPWPPFNFSHPLRS